MTDFRRHWCKTPSLQRPAPEEVHRDTSLGRAKQSVQCSSQLSACLIDGVPHRATGPCSLLKIFASSQLFVSSPALRVSPGGLRVRPRKTRRKKRGLPFPTPAWVRSHTPPLPPRPTVVRNPMAIGPPPRAALRLPCGRAPTARPRVAAAG